MSLVLTALVEHLNSACKYNSNDTSAPQVVLWTDEKCLWQDIIPCLRGGLPIYTLGDYDLAMQTGPDSYLKYELGKTHEIPPILYLPGVSRAHFRSAEEMPEQAKHLFALQYLGQFWVQKSHKDWTPSAFLQSEHGGLNLEVAQDQDTKESIQNALRDLMEAPLTKLTGIKLEASDFQNLSTPDPVKELLNWINSPTHTEQWTESQQKNFQMLCKKQYGFNPESDGVISAAQHLAEKNGDWELVWERFSEAPERYSGVVKQLENVTPAQDNLFLDKSSWPRLNTLAEESLGKALLNLTTLSTLEAKLQIQTLEIAHGIRREWVWASIGKSPLAEALRHFSVIIEETQKPFQHDSWIELANYYNATGHKVDDAMLRALEQCTNNKNQEIIHQVIHAIYMPWVEQLSLHTQTLAQSYPNLGREQHREFSLTAGHCLLFIDGLRYDIGVRVRQALDRRYSTTFYTDWAALPSVTSTAKPAWHPLSAHITGGEANADFSPNNSDGKDLTTARFRKLLGEVEVTYLPNNESGDPTQTSWTECADIDSLGHKEGWKLAKQIDRQVEVILERIKELIEAGWHTVEIITDHGWLLSPLGLEKEELPAHLTHSKWGRSALPSAGARHQLQSIPWTWDASQEVVIPSGAKSFRKGEYAHGGISLQECCIPRLSVQAAQGEVSSAPVSLASANWAGLRYKAKLENAAGFHCDIRLKANVAETSLLTHPASGASHCVKDNNTVSLLIEDDDQEGASAVFVILDSAGNPIFKHLVTIAE